MQRLQLSLAPPELCGEKQSPIFLTFTGPQNSDVQNVQDWNVAEGDCLEAADIFVKTHSQSLSSSWDALRKQW